MLEVLQQQELFANRKKCQFSRKQIKYMGHVISKEWVVADPQKVNAMVDWPVSRNIKELKIS